MKKLIIALILLLVTTASASAMSYEQARDQALFLTDKMAYELNLTEDQYEAAYEINLDYLMGVNSYDDLYGLYWRQRNIDLSYVLLDWQYNLYCAANYFYRPLYWSDGFWRFGVYARYPNRTYFFYGRPQFVYVYRGGHSWRYNGGRSWYTGRDWGRHSHYEGRYWGMRDGFQRGDYRSGFDNRRPSGNNSNASFGGSGNRGNASFGNNANKGNSSFNNNNPGSKAGFGNNRNDNNNDLRNNMSRLTPKNNLPALGITRQQQQKATTTGKFHSVSSKQEMSTRPYTGTTRPSTSGFTTNRFNTSTSKPSTERNSSTAPRTFERSNISTGSFQRSNVSLPSRNNSSSSFQRSNSSSFQRSTVSQPARNSSSFQRSSTTTQPRSNATFGGRR